MAFFSRARGLPSGNDEYLALENSQSEFSKLAKGEPWAFSRPECNAYVESTKPLGLSRTNSERRSELVLPTGVAANRFNDARR